MTSTVTALLVITTNGPIAIVIDLLFFAALVLSFIAVVKIITQAGYSGAWILLPVGTVVLEFLFAAVLTSTGSRSLSDLFNKLTFLFFVEVLGVLVNWVAFIVFAFSTWPVTRDAERRSRPTAPSFVPASAAAPTSPAPPIGAPTTGAQPPDVSSLTSPTDSIAPSPNRTIYCVWCGKGRPADSIAIHHCGSRDRPPQFCQSCGSDLPDGSTLCQTCGTSNELTPRR